MDRGLWQCRLGTKGQGIFPNYKIEEASRLDCLELKGCRLEMTAIPSLTYNGRTHKAMSELDDLERQDAHWSDTVTPLAELRLLLLRWEASNTLH
jgi:hypothetical protein